MVRVTGGLSDSIHEFGDENGNGYNFPNIDAYDMLPHHRAYEAYQDKPAGRIR